MSNNESVDSSLLDAAIFSPKSVELPSAWLGHVSFAMWVIREVSPRIFVELGTHTGASYFAFCQSVAEARLPTQCYAVDTWQDDKNAGQYGEEIFSQVSAHSHEYYAGFSHLLRMSCDDAVTYFADESIDILHIDGLRTYEAIRHDFETWLPKLVPGAVVLFHDISVRERNCGVWRLWEDLREQHPNNIEFRHSYGLGVLQLANAPREKELKWLKIQASEREKLVDYFEALGLRQLDRYELSEARRATIDLNATIARCTAQITELEYTLQSIYGSTSWRLTGPVRLLGRYTATMRSMSVRAIEAFRRAPSVSIFFRKSWRVFRAEGLTGLKSRLGLTTYTISAEGDKAQLCGGDCVPGKNRDRYLCWLQHNTMTDEAAQKMRDSLAVTERQPILISVLMPIYNTPRVLLERTIGSLKAQVYPYWEACIVDDCSTDGGTLAALSYWVANEPRIRVMHRGTNGNISVATNDAANMATGKFLVFLDHDDELAPDALAEVASVILSTPEVDYIYSDDDKITEDGVRFAPQFKPGLSPVLLLSYMYMAHLKAVRTSLYRDLGGFRSGFEGAQDYDFALRVTEATRNIVHIPKVLYHWRVTAGSTAAGADEKPQSIEAGRRAVCEAVARRGIVADVFQPEWAFKAKVGVYDLRFPDKGPRVTIVIPTKNHKDLLSRCLGSLAKTAYRDYEILIIDNDSDDAKTLRYLQSLPHKVVKIVNPKKGGFSYAYINNKAVQMVSTDYVLLLNDDTEVINPGWLSQMMGYAQMKGVGAVGAKLLFADRTIQHAGIVHGLYGGMAGPAFRGIADWDNGYQSYAAVTREYSAVTAACLLIKRELFLTVGGFDENEFAVAYNDVDLCYRLVDTGNLCVYCHSAQLFHYEGRTRGHGDAPREIAAFRKRYRSRKDNWYNPNLSLDDEKFRIQPYHRPVAPEECIRVAMVTHNLNHEGAPNSQLELAIGLKRSGRFDPHIFTPEDGPLRYAYESAGIQVEVIDHRLACSHTLEQFEARLQPFVQRLKAENIAVVYGNTLQTFWAIHAAKVANLPAIWNPRESEPWQTYFNFLTKEIRAVAYTCFGYPYRIIFVAQATRVAWEALNTQANFTVIHNGLDRTRFLARTSSLSREEARASLGLNEGDVAIILLGTVCDRKGQLDLVQAIRHLDHALATIIRVFIVGDRPSAYSDELHRSMVGLVEPIRSRIQIVAETDDVAAYYRSADIAVCTSRIESFPRVVLEAMASGLPMVTTPVFGIREQVRENINGFFYKPGDTSELAKRLGELIENPDLRRNFGDNSRAVLDTLIGYDEMVERYAEIIREARFTRGAPYRPEGQLKDASALCVV